MNRTKILYFAGLAFALVIAVLFLRNGADWTLEDQVQKVAIERADSTRRVFNIRLPKARAKTDAIIADTTTSREEIQTAVTEEREITDSTLAAADTQIAKRDERIKTLEKRQGGKLFLVGNAGVAVPLDGNITGTRFDAEAGLGFKIDQNLMVEATVSLDRELRVKARKQIKLF